MDEQELFLDWEIEQGLEHGLTRKEAVNQAFNDLPAFMATLQDE